MGACACKHGEDTEVEDDGDTAGPAAWDTTISSPELENYVPARSGSIRWKHPAPSTVDKLVLETLNVVGSLVENEQEPPPSMLKLHAIADQEEGWIQVVISLVNVIPLSNPLGPSVITLLLDDCPLPTKDSVLKLSNIFNLASRSQTTARHSVTQHRNICIVLGCLGDKLAGPSSITILTPPTLDYLMDNLTEGNHLAVVLFTLVALEKFSQTTENKITIKKRLMANGRNPLLRLERWADSDSYLEREIGFCAQWCLDNLFLIEGRPLSFECVDTAGINVMLNVQDVSEYLKISPDGLEARSDAYSFESVRCTFQVDSGCWYYEVLLITPGVMQIGWATKDSTFLNHEGCGIGDDKYSVAYDGCRKLVWYNAKSEPQHKKGWAAGNVLGCLLDLNKCQVVFYINGVIVQSCSEIFETTKCGYFAAASFMSFQQCRFNFGSQPFRFPPNRPFQSFNEHAQLSPEKKVVLPRHIRLELLRKLSVREDSCTLCFDKKATVRLTSCGHRGFCSSCTKLLKECPMCRATITEVSQDTS